MAQKLKGIYDAIDHGNYKNCLKLCTAFLQKQPGHALCKALHAVALERCGRRDEALRLCEEAKASPTGVDDTVLSTLQVVYRRCRQFSSIARMYDAAAAKDPDSEEMAMALFTAALRASDFARAQQVATKLYSKQKKQKFLHWVVLSLLLQAKSGAATKVLDLAAMMLQKAPVDKERLGGKDPVPFSRGQLYLLMLHLDTLRMQGKHAAALELLETCREVVKVPSDIASLRTSLLAEAGRASEAAKEARGRFLEHTGDWGAAEEYIRRAFECAAPEALPKCRVAEVEVPDHGARLRPQGGAFPSLSSLEDVDSHGTEDEVWNALLLFRYLQEKSEQEGQEASAKVAAAAGSRVARLAQLELRRRAWAATEEAARAAAAAGEALDWRAAAPEGVADFVTAIKEYLARFAHKPNCFFDLKPFLALLGDEEAAAVAGAVDAGGMSDRRRALEAAKTAARLRRALRFRPPCGAGSGGGGENGGALLGEGAADEVQALLSEWAKLKGEEGNGAADGVDAPEEYLLLAIVLLVDMDRASFHSSGSAGREYLLNAIGLAELGVTCYPLGFHFKVLLVLLHGAVGLPGAMLKWYLRLDIKNVQHETLSYLALDSLGLLGCHEDLRDMSRCVIAFHEDMDKDGDEALGVLLQNGILHRAPEYLESLRNTHRSALWGRAVVEEVLCEVGQAQTWETVQEALARQSVLVSDIAAKPADYWVLRNQDRCLLNGLSPLPLCSPLTQASDHSARAWRRGAAVPTAALLGAPTEAVCSSAAMWGAAVPQAAGGGAAGAGPFQPPDRTDAAAKAGSNATAAVTESACHHGVAAGCSGRRSAVEELLARGCVLTPAKLTLSAATMRLLAALAHRDGPDAARAAKALSAAQAAAAAAGGGAAAAGGEEESWGNPSAAFRDRVQQSALLACEAAHVTLQCVSGQETWEKVEAKLSDISAGSQALFAVVVDKAKDGGDFAPLAWPLLHSYLTVVLPVAVWMSASLPKAGSGKKAKEGQEALHSTRVALRNLLAALQTGLTELQSQVSAAQKADRAAALWPADGAAAAAALDAVPALRDFEGLGKQREQARQAVAEAHRKHLQKLQEGVASRLALLKSRAFKP